MKKTRTIAIFKELPRRSFSQKVERAFVEIVIERAERKGFKKGEFAAQIWPEMSPKARLRGGPPYDSRRPIREASIGIDCGRSAHGGSNRKELSYLLAIAAERASGQK